MLKNWLIRTKSNHILGPISKTKTCELYKNGSIKPDDELCSGNGYWFFVKESDLIRRYLLGDEVQTYNPISEANDALGLTNDGASSSQQSFSHSSSQSPKKEEVHDDEIKMPDEDDLAFPDMGISSAPPPKVSHEPPQAPPQVHVPPSVPDIQVTHSKAAINNVHIEPPKRRELSKAKKEIEHEAVTTPKTSDHKKLYTLAIIVLLMVIAILLYRKNMSKSNSPISSLFSPISEVYADEIEIKKKN